MANFWNVKSIILLNKDPLVKDPKTVNVFAVPKSSGTVMQQSRLV